MSPLSALLARLDRQETCLACCLTWTPPPKVAQCPRCGSLARWSEHLATRRRMAALLNLPAHTQDTSARKDADCHAIITTFRNIYRQQRRREAQGQETCTSTTSDTPANSAHT